MDDWLFKHIRSIATDLVLEKNWKCPHVTLCDFNKQMVVILELFHTKHILNLIRINGNTPKLIILILFKINSSNNCKSVIVIRLLL